MWQPTTESSSQQPSPSSSSSSTTTPTTTSEQGSESPTTAFPGYINVQNLSLDSNVPFLPDAWDTLYNGSSVGDWGGGCAWNDSALCGYGAAGNFSNGTLAGDPLDSDGVNEWRYWALLLLIFPCFTAFGNILVCLSVYKEKSLQSVTNYFIVSLAVADIMVALLVMPLAVYVELTKGQWQLGNALCDTWVAMDVMCCTASILNLTAISVDRFIAVTQPIKYAKHKNSNRVYVMLGLVWLVSLAISSPIALGMNYTERRADTPELCIFYNSDFIIYSSMGSFYIPCLVMVLLYWRIFKAIRDRARKSARKKPKPSKKPPPEKEYKKKNAKSASVIENKAHRAVSGGNGALTSGQGRTTTSDASATEDNSQRELLPSGNSLKLPASKTIHEETSFTNYNAQLNTDTDDNVNTGGGGGPGLAVKSPLSEDTDHVIQNEKSKDFLLSQTSDEGGGGNGGGDFPHKGNHGYSAPTCVEVETLAPVTSPASTKVLLSPPPPRRNMKLGLITVFSPKKLANSYSRENSDEKENGNGNGGGGGGSPNKKSVTKFNFHLRHSKKKKEKLSSRRERKATKTLAIVLGVFLLCWVPFFTINIMNAICIRYDLFSRPECNLENMLFSFFVWLGYINSFLNPLIYTIFNLDFRRAFKKLLMEPCK